jgi:hypothetical protein
MPFESKLVFGRFTTSDLMVVSQTSASTLGRTESGQSANGPYAANGTVCAKLM